MSNITNGFSYFCHHNTVGLEYIDLGMVMWPVERGHFGIIRWGTEVMVFNLNNLVTHGELRREDVLWYEEYADTQTAFDSFMHLYCKLDLLRTRPHMSLERCDIQFPHIKGNLDKCSIINNEKDIIGLMKKCFESYLDGFLDGMDNFLKLYFDKEGDYFK